MTKDLALMMNKNQEWLNPKDFLSTLKKNLDKNLTI